ncbi:MAG: hypothetical protein PWP08_1089 [Methanofollis sp.]|nr:hypothetical protein [Methanofollis sp.]
MKLLSCKKAHAQETRRAVSPEETRDRVRNLSFAGACGVDRKGEGAVLCLYRVREIAGEN